MFIKKSKHTTCSLSPLNGAIQNNIAFVVFVDVIKKDHHFLYLAPGHFFEDLLLAADSGIGNILEFVDRAAQKVGRRDVGSFTASVNGVIVAESHHIGLDLLILGITLLGVVPRGGRSHGSVPFKYLNKRAFGHSCLRN